MYNEENIMNKKITRVFVIVGHSMCGTRKFEIKNPHTCVMTLSKLNDLLNVSVSRISVFFSNILKTLKNPNPDIKSFVDIAKLMREKKIEYPAKDQQDSIRVRCNHGNSKFTVTDQFFFGSSKEKYFVKEGVFMLTREDMSPQDISTQILTPNHTKHLYDETTEFQKGIIVIESRLLVESRSPESNFDDLKKYFESESKNFELEWRNLQRQRILFCYSLNYTSDKIPHTDVDSLCIGIDVMELQHYYDCIIDWEKKNNKSAFGYFKDNESGITEFMKEYSIINYKKIEKGKLMVLIYIRKQQIDYNMTKRIEQGLNTVDYLDFQIIPSSYQEKSCDEILQKINTDYPEDNKLVIFHGCRNIKDSEQDPYHSENEQGVTIERGGAKYGYKNKRKNTSKKNKKINKQKKHSTREYKK